MNNSNQVQAFYSNRTGPLLRVGGQTRVATLDEIEAYGQTAVDLMMENPCCWVTVKSASTTEPACNIEPVGVQALANLCVLIGGVRDSLAVGGSPFLPSINATRVLGHYVDPTPVR